MSKASESILRGAREALAYAKSKGSSMVSELTPWQQNYKQERMPRVPDQYCDSAKKQFSVILKKILFITTASGGMGFDFKNLTEEEQFAIGESMILPAYVQKKLKTLWKRRHLINSENTEFPTTVLIQPTNDDDIEAMDRRREELREEVLINLYSRIFGEHGEKFPGGRREGARSEIHKYLNKIYCEFNLSSIDKLWDYVSNITQNGEHRCGTNLLLQEIDDNFLYYYSNGKEKKIARATVNSKICEYKKNCAQD